MDVLDELQKPKQSHCVAFILQYVGCIVNDEGTQANQRRGPSLVEQCEKSFHSAKECVSTALDVARIGVSYIVMCTIFLYSSG